MSAIKLSTPSSGSISLSPADTASNLTITVPATSATMITNKTAGTVLQVVNATYAVVNSTTANTFSDTGLTASITPTSSSSKILVLVNQSGCQKTGDTTVGLQLLRNSTSILLFDRGGDTGTSVTVNFGGSGCSYLDSPATTSSVTYKTQFRSSLAGATVYVQSGSSTSISTITLIEVAA
jgi:hypothetical protein